MISPIDNDIAGRGRGTRLRVSSPVSPILRRVGTAPLMLALALGVAACSDDGAGDGSSGSDDDGSGGEPSSGGTGSTGNTSSSDNTGGTGNSGNTGNTSSSSGTGNTGGDSGSGGAGAGPQCDDSGAGEPANDGVEGALQLETISDCDSDAATLDGVLAGANEFDWYVFTGTDEIGCVTDPTITVSPALNACMYFYCPEGNAAVTCPEGTTDATNNFGDPGCCGTESLTLSVNCEGSSDDSSWVYVEVQDSTASCTSYSVAYHY